MPEPLTMMAGVAVGSMALDTLGSLFGFGGGGSSESGMTLPPSLEFRMLNDSFAQFQRMEQDYQRAQQLTQFYENKFNSLSEQMLAGIPSDQIRKNMATQTAELASQLGMPIGDAIKNGFLSQDDVDDIASLKELESQDFKDPAYEQARDQQKQQLMQNLQRQGASPQQISQALLDFENTSTIGRFQRSEELREHRAGMITNRMGVRQDTQKMWFDMGSSAINTQMNLQTGWGNQLANAATMAQSAYQVGVTGVGLNAALRGEQQGQYDKLGQYKFSKDAKGYMKTDPYSSGNFQSYQGYKMGQKGAREEKRGMLQQRSFGNGTQQSVSGRQMQAQGVALNEQEQNRIKRY